MSNLSWHDYLLFFSFFAAIAGLGLLITGEKKDDGLDFADRMLFMMSFAYWMVFCVAFVAQRLIQPEWETLLLGVRITGVIAYLLTTTCILSLPLYRMAVRQPE